MGSDAYHNMNTLWNLNKRIISLQLFDVSNLIYNDKRRRGGERGMGYGGYTFKAAWL